MPLPLVSVIIPTYNRADVVGRAVESVLRQTYHNIEVLVVDDGSEDDTSCILRDFGERIGLLRTSNRGVSSARNLGIARSRGEVVAFLDSDDEWLPDKLEAQVSLYPGPQIPFICHTDEIWLRNGKEIGQKQIHAKQGGHFFERALERCLISPSSVMISREMLSRVGLFDESLPAAEDYDLWLRITAHFKVSFVPRRLVIKHGGRDDQLSMVVPAIDRYRIRAIVKILHDPALRPTYRTAAVAELKRKCRIVAAGCMKRGKTAEAHEYLELAESFDTCPD